MSIELLYSETVEELTVTADDATYDPIEIRFASGDNEPIFIGSVAESKALRKAMKRAEREATSHAAHLASR